MLGGKAEETESMQDGRVEAADLAEFGVDVQRVTVAVETVEGGLVSAGRFFDDGASGARGLSWRRRGRCLSWARRSRRSRG